MSTQELTISDQAVELFVAQDDEGQVDSATAVGWCLSPATLRWLEENEEKNPQLVIVVEHDGQEMDRHVVPLIPALRFIQFRRPGLNFLHATIMWTDIGGDTATTKLTKKEDHRTYEVELLVKDRRLVEQLEKRFFELSEQIDRADGDVEVVLRAQRDQVNAELEEARLRQADQKVLQYEFFNGVQRLDSETRLAVVVPDPMFAPEPWAITQWLSTRYKWAFEPLDQCQRRQRALFTLPTYAFYAAGRFVAATVMRLIDLVLVAGLLFLGVRNIDYDPLRYPLEYGPTYLWLHAGPSWWYMKATGETGDRGRPQYEDRNLLLCLIAPPTLAIIAGIVSGIYFVLGVLWIIIIASLVVAVIMAALVAPPVYSALLAEPVKRYKKKRAEAREQEIREAAERRRRELELLACGNAPRVARLSALPKSQRTVYLRWKDTKAKLCKPIAR